MKKVLTIIGAILFYVLMTVVMIESAIVRIIIRIILVIFAVPFGALKLIITNDCGIYDAYMESVDTLNKWLNDHTSGLIDGVL